MARFPISWGRATLVAGSSFAAEHDARVEWRAPQSHTFKNRRRAHAAADAERGEAGREAATLELVEHGAQDHGAGGAQRMAHGDGAAVHIDLVVRHLEDLQVA